MKQKVLYSIALILTLCMSSCAKKNLLTVRVIAQSEMGNDIDFNVFLEDETGNAVTAAYVYVRNNSNCITRLDFDDNSKCYKNTVPYFDSIYYVEIKSALLQDKEIIKIIHEQNETKPFLQNFSDEFGNNVLKGDQLDSSGEILISWNNLGTNCIYMVNISSNLDSLFIKTTNSTSIILDKNVLPKNEVLYISITAQNVYGDIFFENLNYYSLSTSESSLIRFDTL